MTVGTTSQPKLPGTPAEASIESNCSSQPRALWVPNTASSTPKNTRPSGPTTGDDVPLSLMRAGRPLSGSTSATRARTSSVVLFNATSTPRCTAFCTGTVLNAAYTVSPLTDNAG